MAVKDRLQQLRAKAKARKAENPNMDLTENQMRRYSEDAELLQRDQSKTIK